MQPDRCVVAGGIGDHVHRLTIGIMADQDWRKRMQDILFLFFNPQKDRKFSRIFQFLKLVCAIVRY